MDKPVVESGRRRSVFDEPRVKRVRPELSRQIVVDQALRILDAEGEEKLSFRRLAADLNAGVASLYWYVPSREALLDLALDAVAGQLWESIPAKPSSWRNDLGDVARRMYQTFAERPWAGRQQLVSNDRGPNQMRVWDHIGRICLRAGLDDQQAFFAMTAVLSYVLGYVSQESAPAHPDVDRDTYLTAMGEYMASFDPGDFPALHRLIPVFVAHSQRDQFEAGLELLLDGLQLQARSPKSRSRKKG